MALGNEAAHFTHCVECGRKMDTEVLRSGAGYYIGCFCPDDGPHNRESGYYATFEEAEKDLFVYNETGFLRNARL